MSQTNSGWRTAGRVNPADLTDARLQAHHAVQVLTRVARGYIDAKDDDSHTNLGWDGEQGALMGRVVERGSPLQLGLRVADLTLVEVGAQKGGGEPFPFGQRTMAEAEAWVRERLSDRGLPTEPFDEPLHFEIPPHAVGQGRAFDVEKDTEAFAELSRWFHNGFYALGMIASEERGGAEPRCWPHHFDVGILIEVGGEKSIGPGMEPGDESYNQPYFYVNPYPVPETSKLPPLKTGGHWHTEGWTSAIATAEDIVKHKSAAEQEEWTLRFLREAVKMEKSLLTA